VREVLLFLLKFLLLSAVLFVGFTAIEQEYTSVLAHTTAVLAPLTGASVEVLGVDGNKMTLGYGGARFTKTLIFAAFNPVILIALLLATPRIGLRKTLTVGIAGLALLLVAQVVTLRLMLSMDLTISQGGSVGKFRVLETLALISICVNWVLPIVIWIAWVPTGFLTRALKL
jgi:hypothetical protein